MNLKHIKPLPGGHVEQRQGPVIHIEVILIRDPAGNIAQQVKIDTGNLPDNVEGWLAAIDILNIAIKAAANKAVDHATANADNPKPRILAASALPN